MVGLWHSTREAAVSTIHRDRMRGLERERERKGGREVSGAAVECGNDLGVRVTFVKSKTCII